MIGPSNTPILWCDSNTAIAENLYSLTEVSIEEAGVELRSGLEVLLMFYSGDESLSVHAIVERHGAGWAARVDPTTWQKHEEIT